MFSSTLVRLRTHLAAAALGTAFIASAGSAAFAQAQEINIEFSSSAVDANWGVMIQAMRDSMEEIGKELNATFTLNVSDAGLNVDKQISDIQTATVKQPDVLIIDPVDPAGVLPAAQAAKAAGIKLFTIRTAASDPAGLYDGAFETNLEPVYAANLTTWIEGLLAADPALKIKAGILYGAAAQEPQLIRGDVVKTIAAAHPDQVEVVAEKFADWSLETAQNATTDFITAHPDINLIVAANNQMAMGAANAIATAGKTGQVMVATYDIDRPTVQAIIDGKLTFTTSVEFRSYGRAILLGVAQIAQGNYPGTLDVKPIWTVTKDNAAEVLPQLAP
jgi:ABC-type sugar transport system substrate-binding protein